jgi:galactokinase
MIKKFQKLFDQTPLVFQAPGRINLIGEHTDYNQGFVMPAAINKYVKVAVSKREDQKIALYSEQYNGYFEIRIEDIKPIKNHWSNCVSGIVDQLLKRGHSITGFNILIDSDIPIGAGMSSSAALECAAALALSELFQLKLSKLGIATIAQAAENEFAGVECGIMDQFASVFGKKDRGIKLDCKSFNYEYIPLNLEEYQIVLFDTHVKHNLASSEYNNRREECEEGVAIIKKFHPEVSSLRDISLPMLHQYIKDPLILRRCEYVIKENSRLIAGCEELENGDLDLFGLRMYQTHIGLKEEYEVSCVELDYLVSLVKFSQAVLGARMMGGGFGGCTINIIQKRAVEEIIREVGNKYYDNFAKELKTYVVDIVDGASVLDIASSRNTMLV